MISITYSVTNKPQEYIFLRDLRWCLNGFRSEILRWQRTFWQSLLPISFSHPGNNAAVLLAFSAHALWVSAFCTDVHLVPHPMAL